MEKWLLLFWLRCGVSNVFIKSFSSRRNLCLVTVGFRTTIVALLIFFVGTFNLLLLRESVSTLVNTLKNIESISGSVSGLTGDSATQANIKQLIQSLSRIIVD